MKRIRTPQSKQLDVEHPVFTCKIRGNTRLRSSRITSLEELGGEMEMYIPVEIILKIITFLTPQRKEVTALQTKKRSEHKALKVKNKFIKHISNTLTCRLVSSIWKSLTEDKATWKIYFQIRWPKEASGSTWEDYKNKSRISSRLNKIRRDAVELEAKSKITKKQEVTSKVVEIPLNCASIILKSIFSSLESKNASCITSPCIYL